MKSIRALLRETASAPSVMSIEDMMADEENLKSIPSVGVGEGLPSISVGSEDNPKDKIAVKFLEKMGEITQGSKPGQDGKIPSYCWTKVQVLAEHEGYDSKTKKACKLQKGDEARINLNRHTNLMGWAKQADDLKDRSFIIVTKGIVKTAKGKRAMDYGVVEITGKYSNDKE